MRSWRGDGQYCSFDSTAISSYSGNLSDEEASRGKQDPELMHFAIAAVHGSVAGGCAYYRMYRGDIPDVRTIDNFSKTVEEMGYPFKKVIVDRGYASAENIYRLHNEMKAELLVMLPSGFGVYGRAVEKVRGTFESDSHNYIPGQGVFGKTIPEELDISAGGKDVRIRSYVHVYFSPMRKADETSRLQEYLCDRITALNLDFASGKISLKDAVQRSFSADNKKCIRVRRTSNTRVVFEKDDEAVNSALAGAGYFCILSTQSMDSAKALLTYRSRDGVERTFNVLKNDVGFKRAQVKTDQTLQGKVFCVMLSCMIASYMRDRMRDARRNGIINRKLTYGKLIHELECIYTYKMGKKRIWTEISERQRTIFSILGIEAPSESAKFSMKEMSLKKQN